MSNWFADDAAREIVDLVREYLDAEGLRAFEHDAANIIESAIDDALDDAMPGDYETGREDAFEEVEGMIADQLHRIELLHLDTDLSAAEVLRKIQDALGQISA